MGLFSFFADEKRSDYINDEDFEDEFQINLDPKADVSLTAGVEINPDELRRRQERSMRKNVHELVINERMRRKRKKIIILFIVIAFFTQLIVTAAAIFASGIFSGG